MRYQSNPVLRVLILCAVFAALLAVAGCGDNSRIAGTTTPTNPVNPVTSPTPPPATPTPTPAPAATTAVQVRLGDAPADQLLSFELTFVSPLKATLSTGEEVTADLASNNRIELTHMASKFEPLLLASLPQGTYTSATITIANPSLIYVYAPSKQQPSLTKKDFPGTQTVTVNFNPPITFGPDASVFNLDINVANTLSFDSNDDHLIAGVDFTLPGVFNFTQQSIGAAGLQQHDNGELESVIGTVTAVGGNSLVISTGQSGALLNVFVDGATIFSDPLKGLGDAANQIVEVQGYTAADGTFVANSVQALTSNAGASVEGVVVGPDGNSLISNDVLSFVKPPNAFTLLTQDGTGSGTKLDDVGFIFTVQTGTSTVPATFSVDYGKCDWTGLEENQSEYFVFDDKHLFAGQRVAAVTGSALPANDLSPFIATSISLQQQPIVGTITKYYPPAVVPASGPTPSTTYPGTIFLLTLPADSYLASLSGSTQIWVYQGPATDIEFLSTNGQQSIGVGTVVRVRGMLFDSPKPRSFMTKDGFVPPDNSLTMVARRVTEMISAPNPAPLVK